MIERALHNVVYDGVWGRQMRMIAGPRQCGKTTMAKRQLELTGSDRLYYLWDSREVRQRYKANELFFTADCPAPGLNTWVCFDELHKVIGWKNLLKAIFDQVGDKYHFTITGSAKFDLLKKAGDSLAGRYMTFHLDPLHMAEVSKQAAEMVIVYDSAEAWIKTRLGGHERREAMGALLEYGGMPEPFVKQSGRFYRRWAADYIDTVIREDIGTLTRIVDREKIFDMYSLLPGMVGSPVSEASCAAHIEVSPVTGRNYLRRLADFYLGFTVAPYSRNIKRALLKAKKFYLFDWPAIEAPGPRFECFVACQLRALMEIWSDKSGRQYEMRYIRNKQKEETDFLILRDRTPWALIECKTSDGPVEGHHVKTARDLGGIPIVQVCREHGIACMQARDVYRVSASRFL